MVDGFQRLRHDAVVSRHHKDRDVGRVGAAGSHGREGLVPRSVDDRDVALLGVDFVSADVLGDAAGFALGDLALADGVDKRSFAVVNVSHEDDDGSPGGFFRGEFLFVSFLAESLLLEIFLFALDLNIDVQFGGGQDDMVFIQGAVDVQHLAHLEENFDDVANFDADLLGEVPDADRNGDFDVALYDVSFGRLSLDLCLLDLAADPVFAFFSGSLISVSLTQGGLGGDSGSVHHLFPGGGRLVIFFFILVLLAAAIVAFPVGVGHGPGGLGCRAGLPGGGTLALVGGLALLGVFLLANFGRAPAFQAV